MQKKEQVLKILIGLGIIAIIISGYLKYGRATITEFSNNNLDEIRINDLNNLNNTLMSITKHKISAKLGEPNKIYISTPSEYVNCQDKLSSLPLLPEHWEYRCAKLNNLQKVDGTGWIPVNLINQNEATIKELPIDPKNTIEDLSYYSFVGGSLNILNNENSSTAVKNEDGYILTSILQTKKYINEKTLIGSSTDAIRYEVGSNHKLWADAQGLAGYWPMDDDNDEFTIDKSGNNGTAKFVNEVNHVDGKINGALRFSAESSSHANAGKIMALNNKGVITIATWIKPGDKGTRILGKYNNDSTGGWYLWFSPEGRYTLGVADGTTNSQLKSKESYPVNEWHYIVASYNASDGKMSITVDSTDKKQKIEKKGIIQSSYDLYIGGFMAGGGGFFNGEIDDLRIYTRDLKNNELNFSN